MVVVVACGLCRVTAGACAEVAVARRVPGWLDKKQCGVAKGVFQSADEAMSSVHVRGAVHGLQRTEYARFVIDRHVTQGRLGWLLGAAGEAWAVKLGGGLGRVSNVSPSAVGYGGVGRAQEQASEGRRR